MPIFLRASFLHLAIPAVLAPLLAAAATDARAAPAGPAGPVAIGGGSGLVVGGIAVEASGDTPDAARKAGWLEAERLAWPRLWARLSGQPPEAAPKLADGAIDAMVAAIEIEKEQVGGVKPAHYVARVAVVFDRARAGAHLGAFARFLTSPPLLLLPVLQDAGTRMAHEPASPWLQAWARLRAGETPIDYVRIQPAAGDQMLLNAWTAERRQIGLWRLLVDRYQVADVLIPELWLERSWAGGPLDALLIVRFGPEGRELGRLKLRNQGGDVAGLMDEAVRQADRIYVAALRAGQLAPDSRLLEAEAPPPDVAGPAIGATGAAVALYHMRLTTELFASAPPGAGEQRLRAIPGVNAVTTLSFMPGGEAVFDIAAAVPPDLLRYRFDQNGLRIDGDRLRQRQPDEAPLAPPVLSEDATVETGAAGSNAQPAAPSAGSAPPGP
jgi:hypothetical protein